MIMTASPWPARSSSAGRLLWFLAISVITGLGIGADYGLRPRSWRPSSTRRRRRQQGQEGTYFAYGRLATKLARRSARRARCRCGACGLKPAKACRHHALIIAYIVCRDDQIGRRAADLVHPIEAVRGSVRDELLGHRLA